MHELPQSSEAERLHKFDLYSLHKTFGMLAFAVAVLRVSWAVFSPKPRLLNADKPLESIAAETVHWILYAAILLTPLFGYLHHVTSVGFAPIYWPFGQTLPFLAQDADLARIFGTLHKTMAFLIMASLLLHIGGAMKHFVIDRDQTLQRMIPGAYRATHLPIIDREAQENHRRAKTPVLLAASVYVFALAIGLFSTNKHIHISGHQHDLAYPAEDSRTRGWVVDHAESELAIAVSQMGLTVDGRFESWSASIDLDPENVAAASIMVTVDTSSISLGQVSEPARSADFLNAVVYPTAKFTSNDVIETEIGSFEARGILNLHGAEVPTTLYFQLNIEDDIARATGSTTINRLDYGIGAAGFKDENTVGFDVIISFKVTASQTL